MRTSTPLRSRSDRLHAVAKAVSSVLLASAVIAAAGGYGQNSTAVVRTAAATPAASGAADPTVTIDGTEYPNPLRTNNGNTVNSAASWEGERRAELLADFREHVYGQSLPNPIEQTFDVAATDSGDVTRKIVTIGITGPQGSGSFDLKLFVPNTGTTPRGTFLMIDHRGSVSDDPGQSSGYAPVAEVTEAGYAFAQIDAGDIAPDDSDSYRSKMIDLFHPPGQELPDDAGRAISAWAWGASRAMDYLETDPDIDPAKVAVIGHSRGGKASLWAGAQDTRFAATVTNNSGSTGAKPARRGDGAGGAETVERVNNSFPHWFPQTYKAYNGRENSLPVDQHQLLALVAPRRIVVGSATNDANADPEGEFLSYVAAAPVYELYGLGDTGLPSTNWKPATDTGFRGPAMSYHLRSGEHGLSAEDWDIYLNGNLFSR
ncbi:dienelactone hydrolase family protein [Pseudonocardia parietis]|uniref:4-O-methyl-glucuronoyl methylesterase-like domain-containing protein n=1 Tax=Pseudonocardia parietis TaxID=570936 RepID=A0ABS4VTM2_9PSEU|nr:acetylxylan esterase [Pseudonocardia parietis]MBP2367261.1 hypothetical protein [Pseudonocardia parietis]